MIYDPHTQTIVYRAYKVPVRCWRCWKKYHFYAPNEFEDVVLYSCERCSEARITQVHGDGEGLAKSKYLDFHHPSLGGWGSKEEDQKFLFAFENHWTEPCSCGGRFRLKAPIRCLHCCAREIRWLRGRQELVDSPPIPALKFTIPPEYAQAPRRPPRDPHEPEI